MYAIGIELYSLDNRRMLSAHPDIWLEINMRYKLVSGAWMLAIRLSISLKVVAQTEPLEFFSMAF